jgi:hypothetical protein
MGQPHILQTTRAQFETLLLEIAEQSEEWLTSAQAMGLTKLFRNYLRQPNYLQGLPDRSVSRN